MDLRCTYCQTMFAISRDDTLAALEHMEEHHQMYYDAHCPRCRRANRVERFKLEYSYPNWRQVIAERVKVAPAAAAEPAAPVQETVAVPAPAPAVVPEPAAKKRHPSHKPTEHVEAAVVPVEKPVATPSPEVKEASKPAPKKVVKKSPAAKPPKGKAAPKAKPAAKPAAKKPAPKPASPKAKKPAAPARGKKTTSGAKKK